MGDRKSYYNRLQEGSISQVKTAFCRVLVTETMKNFDKQYPKEIRTYLNTQPLSYKVIKLYNDFGFNMLRQDKFGKAENEHDEAMFELKKNIFPDVYSELIKTSKE